MKERPGRYSQKNWLVVCGPPPKTPALPSPALPCPPLPSPALFMTKICEINSSLYLSLFMT